MQTALASFIKETPQGQEADAILRNCVHCGFCTATCPTYQDLGDELDGPRGRIYLIKQVLEGKVPSVKTQTHLDRCLTCRACETTCPSGVQYGRLLDIGREVVESQVARPWRERLLRRGLRIVLRSPPLFTPLLRLGQCLRPLLPAAMRRSVPRKNRAGTWPSHTHGRRMLLLDGCVQPAIAPSINVATARVLDRLGITLIRAKGAGCCGALSQHLSAQDEALAHARANIDAWWPHIEAGCEAIVITASGCGTQVKEYGHLLRHDPDYGDKAARVSELARDISELLAKEDLSVLTPAEGPQRIAFHAPCSLQHGQQIRGVVESLLRTAGFELTHVPDAHLCCGSAGTYAILQKNLAQRFLANKVQALESGGPTLIATANIGCLTHLQSGAHVPVYHWIELLSPAAED